MSLLVTMQKRTTGVIICEKDLEISLMVMKTSELALRELTSQ